MISDYLDALLEQANYHLLPDGTCLGQIPGQRDLWAEAPTPAACRLELRAVLDAWALDRLTTRQQLPAINGLHLLKDNCALCPFTPLLLERPA
jgi:hypothetical protein